MYVLAVGELQSMAEMPAHDILIHTEGGPLVEWRVGVGPVLFISHTWLSVTHPDPQGTKWTLLREFLSGVAKGRIHVGAWWSGREALVSSSPETEGADLQDVMRDGYLWMDYVSVPQRREANFSQALRSLPSYIADASFFICLVPPSHHEDGTARDARAWSRRGWCRAERLANELSPFPKRCIVVESLTSMYISVARDWLYRPVGRGEFAFPEDRSRLGPVVLAMIEARKGRAIDDQDLNFFRLLEAMKEVLLEGTPTQGSVVSLDSYDTWMSTMRFSSPHDEQNSGWTPLRFAAYAGRLDIMRELLQQGASVHATLVTGAADRGYHTQGCTVVHGLSFTRESPEGIGLLVSCKADVCAGDAVGSTALHFACKTGRCANIAAIMTMSHEVANICNHWGAPAWHGAVVDGHREAFLLLRRKHRSLGRTGSRGDASNGSESFALTPGNNIDHVWEPRGTLTRVHCALCQAQCYVSANAGVVTEGYANVPGMTALLWCAYFGNRSAVQLCLDHKADVDAKNFYDRSALILAAMGGHLEITEILIAAGSSVNVKDRWGRSALDWADKRQHSSISRVLRARNDILEGDRWCNRRCVCNFPPATMSRDRNNEEVIPEPATGHKAMNASRESL